MFFISANRVILVRFMLHLHIFIIIQPFMNFGGGPPEFREAFLVFLFLTVLDLDFGYVISLL
jgi:hypothetical protein